MAGKKKKASKKKSKVNKKKRSEAAKKGWETRRRREQERRFRELNPELVGVENVRLEDLLKEAEERGRKKGLEERTTKAVTDELVRRGKLEDTREARIKARLRIVGGPDARDYYDEVLDIANDDDYLDYTPTEIYTMGFY